MLTARTANLQPIAGTFGALKPADIAAMMSGLKRRKFLAGMLVLAGDMSTIPELHQQLYMRAIFLAADASWNLPEGPKILEALARMVVLDITTRGKPCARCEASGVYTDQQGFKSSCEPCRGTGKRAFSEAELCELTGIHPRSWSRTWAARYNAIYADFSGDVEDAKRFLKRRMRD